MRNLEKVHKGIWVDGDFYPYSEFESPRRQDFENSCQLHHNIPLQFISTDPNLEIMFKCIQCVQDNLISEKSIISIKSILKSDSSAYSSNYIFQNDDLNNLQKKILNDSLQVSSSMRDILKKLIIKFADKIDNINKNIEENTEKYLDSKEYFKPFQNEDVLKESLKSIIQNKYKHIESKSKEIKELFKKIKCKDEETRQKFSQFFYSRNQFQNVFIDEESINYLSRSIFTDLDIINQFVINDVKRLDQQMEFSSISSDHPEIPSSAINTALSLLTFSDNRKEETQADSCLQLEQLLKTYRLLLLQLPEYEKTFSLESRNDVLGHQQKAKSCSNQTQILKNCQIAQFMELSNNYYQEDTIQEYQNIFYQIEGLIGLFNNKKKQSLSKIVDLSSGLNEQQIKDIQKLTSQIVLLNENHSDFYPISQNPKKQVQLNSYNLMNLISKTFLSKIDFVEERNQIKIALNNLLVQYPIFELLPLQFQIPIPKLFTLTSYCESNEMTLSKNKNEINFTFENSFSKYGQGVSQVLKNDCGYLLRLKFNRPYGKHGKSGYFRIGLIPNSHLNTKCVNPSMHSGFCSAPNSGADIIVKGGLLDSEPLRSKTSEIEFRWCIQKQQFFISDLSYKNINKAQERYFQPAELYHFGVCFYSISEDDWVVTITEFYETDSIEVSLFE